MPPGREKKGRGLELSVSWMLGALVLLVSNSTVFKAMDASVGEPWLNLILSALILTLLGRIAVTFYNLQREVKISNSRIDRVDRLDDGGLAAYMRNVYRGIGWSATEAEALFLRDGTSGGMFFGMASGNGRRVVAAFHSGKRKLTKEYVAASSAALRTAAVPSSGGNPELWLVTNVSFTAQACKEASRLGVRLVDRKALIDLLADTDVAPVPLARRRQAAE